MDDGTERDILARLEHIERYLRDLSQVSGGAPFAAYGQGADSYDTVPESFEAQDSLEFPGWSGAPPVQPFLSASGGVPADIVAMARSGRVMDAIKTYRTLTGVSLKQAREAVEQAAGGY